MIEQKVYVCEFCGSQYENEQEALDCEKYHRKPKKINQACYNSRKKYASDGYPDSINILFDDGSLIWYTRYKGGIV